MSEIKIYVASQNIPLMAKSTNRAAEVVAYSTLSNTPINDGILMEAMGGMSAKATQAYLYGKNHYTLGLPSCGVGGLEQVPNSIIEAIIEAELGVSITIDYAVITDLSGESAILDFIIANRGYDPSDSTVSSYPFTLAHPNSNPVYVYGTVLNPGTETVTVKYKHEYDYNGTPTYEYFEEDLPVDPSLMLGGKYCVVHYYLSDGSSHMWYYNTATGTYPQLEVTFEGFGLDAFMPVVPLRKSNVDLTATKDELYKTSKSLLRKLNIKIDDLAATLNENPDIADIDHAYVMFGINADSDEVPDIHYLAEYFNYLHTLQAYSSTDYSSSIINSEYPGNTIVKTDIYRSPTNTISDVTLSEHGLYIELAFDYVTVNLVEGTIGKRWHATKEVVLSSEEIIIEGGESDKTVELDTSHFIYRLQVSTTHYKEVIVYNLTHVNKIYKNYAIVTSIRDTQIVDEDGEKNTNLIIPIHYGVMKQIQILKRNQIYNNSLILIINSWQKVKLKWYATTIFKVVVMVASIAIIVLSWGTATPAVTTWMGAFAVLWKIVFMIALSYAFKFILEKVGPEWGVVIAIVAIIIAMLTNNFSSVEFAIPTAQALLQAVMAIIQSISSALEFAAKEVMDTISELQTEYEALFKELEVAKDLLEMESHYDPLNFTRMPYRQQVPHESPDAFYDRTIHTGNVGTIVLDVINKYCDIMLKLPDPKYS